jgi:hypothetical protein
LDVNQLERFYLGKYQCCAYLFVYRHYFYPDYRPTTKVGKFIALGLKYPACLARRSERYLRAWRVTGVIVRRASMLSLTGYLFSRLVAAWHLARLQRFGPVVYLHDIIISLRPRRMHNSLLYGSMVFWQLRKSTNVSWLLFCNELCARACARFRQLSAAEARVHSAAYAGVFGDSGC